MSAPKRQKTETHPFNFPFPPYSIQEELMKELYETLSERKIGIFESPTGTGKSLSLICGTLTWLEDHTDSRGVLLEHAPTEEAAKPATDEPAWLRDYAVPSNGSSGQAELTALCAKLDEIRANPTHARIKDMRLMHGGRDKLGARKATPAADVESDENYIVPEYQSDKEAKDNSDDEEDDTVHGFDEPVDYGIVQASVSPGCHANIFYCSRTHSQLSQFMHEIKKTKFGAKLRTLTLGARKSLCIHPDVRKLTSDTAMNDKCLDLIQSTSGKKKAPGCPYNKKQLQRYFRHHALAQVQDIEELHALGDQLSSCAYYGARSAISAAQVIAMPYSMLLSKATRESMGISLKNNIVIFDEAHNIADAVNSTYTVMVSSHQWIQTRRQVWSYYKRYEGRLKGRNVYYIKQLLTVLQSSHKFLMAKAKLKDAPAVWSITDFLFETKLDNINLFKIHEYLERSQLSHKLLGFLASEYSEDGERLAESTAISTTSLHISPLRSIQAFMMALTTATTNGRLVLHFQEKEGGEGRTPSLKFLLLNPALHFADVLAEARSVILAGGTMQPIDQVLHQLLLGSPPSRLHVFSCGHIIPPTHLTGVALSVGPTNHELDFTFQKRNLPQTMDEVGRILINLVRIVPAGVVCFFPSYAYEQQIVAHWMTNGQLAAMKQKKSLFREPKSAAEVDSVLTSYAAACADGGALLFSVVGGKMSEGINFSDDLARCVVMVGLPYPNPSDPELLEQMKYMEKSGAKMTSHEFYSNMCMKAVNQSIGRSIRHRNDYASIVLLDRRYNTPIIRTRLPQWINDRTVHFATFGPALPHLVQFFKQHAAETAS
ncbi:ATP-dependent RNA helicase [Achlya hypogyna]|uniref:DNA 5'-3' helicase n=1 Tax=Achlya hypogyna TaxID=1202772 RepID=A0A1V9YMJ0_ACHHY|nr:ATP-dependent RNA helicase [Achlya hypogyna]